MRKVRLPRWLATLALVAWPALVHADGLDPPKGQVVLTVVGAIDVTNRGAYDEADDVFFKYHERSFAKAAVFDRAMLEALGMHAITMTFDAWPEPARFEGPWLADVLAAVGGIGKDVVVLALDGYASEISAVDLAAYDWMVAVKRDGRYLDIGGRGPCGSSTPGATARR